MSSPDRSNDDDAVETTRVKVVVIGAGASGLMCCHKLLASGLLSIDDILILEARSRVGGRIHTTEETVRPVGEDSLPIRLYRDHGAAWVHGTGWDWPHFSPQTSDDKDKDNDNNPMMELLAQGTPEGESVCLTHLQPTFELGNPWMRPGHVLVGSKNLVLYVDGEKLDGEDSPILLEALEVHHKIMKDVGRIGYNLITSGRTNETVQQSVLQGLNQVLLEKDPKDSSSHTKTDLIAAFYRYLIEAWHGTSASNIQLRECSVLGSEDYIQQDDKWTDEGDFYGPHCTMKKGMQTVLEPLVRTASSCIRLDQPVRSVQKRAIDDRPNHTILVETTSGMVVQADYCVVTVSLGCLSHSLKSVVVDGAADKTHAESGTIAFSPNLSDKKHASIQRMCMGFYKKVFLSFDRVFWPSKEPFIGLARRTCGHSQHQIDGIGNFLLLDNLWACKGIPCIEAILIGDAGQWATDKPDDTIRDAVLSFLAQAMGLDFEKQLSPWCVDCHITRWEEDPYSRGAYSGYRLGTLQEHTAGLAASEWDGSLLFAGEATLSGHEGSVHAALISGVDVANQIEKEMKNAL